MSTPNEELTRLAKKLGVRNKDLLVMAPDRDPFNCGSPQHLRLAKWFVELWEEHGPTHIRDLHYVAASRQLSRPTGKGGKALCVPYLNDDPSQEALSKAAKHARNLGLVDPLEFDDHRNLDVRHFAPEPPGYPTATTPWLSVTNANLDIPERRDAPLFPRPPFIHGYDYEPHDQPYRLEVWAEKELTELIDVCRELRIELYIGSGFQSQTRIVELANSVYKPTRVLVVSDFDASGEAMPRQVARYVEFYLPKINPDADLIIDHLALTADQLDTFGLPPIPHKAGDSAAASFEFRHGVDGRAELNALTALHPGALADIVRDRADEYRDNSWERRLYDTERSARHAVNAAWEEKTEEEREEFDAIVADYEELYSRFEDEFGDIRERLDELNESLDEKAKAHALGIELPDRPGIELDEPDETDVLFRPDRDFLEQLEYYKRHKNGGTE